MSILRKAVESAAFKLATYYMDPIGQPDGSQILDSFLARCAAMKGPRVLELGTRRSIPTRSTRHDLWVPNASEYLGTDIEAGIDVDVVADVHRLSKVVGEERFDVIISSSSFEHFKYPHLAAHEIMKTLRIGGLLFIQTHQAFPIHSYPYDYFRFSREAMVGLFGTKMGVNVLATDYEFPVRLFAPRVPNARNETAYLNVRLTAEKIAKTPPEYIYEFDTAL